MNRFFKSVGFAWRGVHVAWREQRHLKIHTACALAVMAAGFAVGLSRVEWIVVVIAIALVFVAELINSSIEELVNLVSPEHRPLAGKVKDIAAGAVLVAAIAAVVLGVLVFSNHL
ncbi:MAG: diacylglycerol kinase family protein [Cyclobacteriaceae bacterium]|nr:diacylglycerol kinase family protein [Cyclobacteriaceae bacterium]